MAKYKLEYRGIFGIVTTKTFNSSEDMMRWLDQAGLRSAYDSGNLIVTTIPSVDEDKYVKYRGSVCPNCTSRTIESKGSLQWDSDRVWQEIRCLSCNATWTDTYILTGYDLFEVPS